MTALLSEDRDRAHRGVQMAAAVAKCFRTRFLDFPYSASPLISPLFFARSPLLATPRMRYSRATEVDIFHYTLAVLFYALDLGIETSFYNYIYFKFRVSQFLYILYGFPFVIYSRCLISFHINIFKEKN